MYAIIAGLLLTSCAKKELDDVTVESATTVKDASVQNSRLVFSNYGAWQNAVNKIISFDQTQLADWQKKFTGFVPLSSSDMTLALNSKPDGKQPVDAYFLAILNKDGVYQIGNDVYIFSNNVLYTLVNATEAKIESTKQDIQAGTAVASANLKIAKLKDNAPKYIPLSNNSGGKSSQAGKTAYIDLVDESVQYQWYNGNNIYFKYNTTFALNTSYYYNNHAFFQVYLENNLKYSKSNVSWWALAGESCNKTFSTIAIVWSGVGQQNLAGGWGPVYSQYLEMPSVSRTDNQPLITKIIIGADQVDRIQVTGTISNSVNWNTSQSVTKNLNYSVLYTFQP